MICKGFKFNKWNKKAFMMSIRQIVRSLDSLEDSIDAFREAIQSGFTSTASIRIALTKLKLELSDIDIVVELASTQIDKDAYLIFDHINFELYKKLTGIVKYGSEIADPSQVSSIATQIISTLEDIPQKSEQI